MSQVQPNQPQAVVPPGDEDPLARLHKMSTTAGLGSGDYVAVNGAAVFALILGFASALSLLNELLLLVPLAGIVVAVIALRQIRHSNGTQTGVALVILGLLLMLGFGGAVFGIKVRDEMRLRSAKSEISTLVEQLGKDVSAGNFDAVYPMLSNKLRERVKPQECSDRLKLLQQSEVYGKLIGAKAGRMQFQTDESTGATFAVSRVGFELEKLPNRPLPDDLSFKFEDGKWKIEGFNLMFPPPQRPGG